MRSRVKLRCDALLTASGWMGMLLMLTFFFYDGPIRLPGLMPSALATVQPESETLEPDDASLPETEAPVFNLAHQPEWTTVSLDQASVRLRVLKTPLKLADTTRKSGSEAFAYASYLYEQMAKEVPHHELAVALKKLSMEAQAMGQALRQASEIRFDGPPAEDMSHLQAHSAIFRHLRMLNNGALITARYNQQGDLLEMERSEAAPGLALSAYMAQVERMLQHPAAAAYPETMRIVSQESELLKQIAGKLTLRWESTLYCPGDCEGVATFMRIYARQTLPEQTLVSAHI